MPLRKTFEDLVEDARCRVDEIDVDELAVEMARPGTPLLVLDVREVCERMFGHIPGSVHCSRGLIERDLPRKAFNGFVRETDLVRPIVCHCAGGARSLLAADSLKQMGFSSVSSLRGGFKAWAGAGRPVAVEQRWGSGLWHVVLVDEATAEASAPGRRA